MALRDQKEAFAAIQVGSKLLRLTFADFGSTCKIAQDTLQRRKHKTICVCATVSVARFRGCFRRASVCVSSRWKVLSGEFRRRPTTLAKKLRELDRVGRRGLFEPRENFSRLPTYAFRGCNSVADSVADSVAVIPRL